jgi:hypothetical protein
VGQIFKYYEKCAKLNKREQLIVLEIGGDVIDSASAFVDYISEAYGFSKSSVWYNLNRLKDEGMIDFASRDEVGKPLALTKSGMQELRLLEPDRHEIVDAFERISIENNVRWNHNWGYGALPQDYGSRMFERVIVIAP